MGENPREPQLLEHSFDTVGRFGNVLDEDDGVPAVELPRCPAKRSECAQASAAQFSDGSTGYKDFCVDAQAGVASEQGICVARLGTRVALSHLPTGHWPIKTDQPGTLE
jgi:hypothetical protein